MKKNITHILVTMILTLAFVLILQALLPERAPSLTTPAAAQNIVTGNYYTVTQDTFIITASSTGDEVYVYFFDAKPEEESSTVKFVTKSKAP